RRVIKNPSTPGNQLTNLSGVPSFNRSSSSSLNNPFKKKSNVSNGSNTGKDNNGNDNSNNQHKGSTGFRKEFVQVQPAFLKRSSSIFDAVDAISAEELRHRAEKERLLQENIN